MTEEVDNLSRALSPSCKECGEELREGSVKVKICPTCMWAETLGTGD
jgi:predicted Zn-ribbon and HTH transcriptional regulator